MNIDLKNYPECEVVSWHPVIEPDFNQERFATQDPTELFKKGEFAKVNVLAGIVTDEFVSFVPSKFRSFECVNQLIILILYTRYT